MERYKILLSGSHKLNGSDRITSILEGRHNVEWRKDADVDKASLLVSMLKYVHSNVNLHDAKLIFAGYIYWKRTLYSW